MEGHHPSPQPLFVVLAVASALLAGCGGSPSRPHTPATPTAWRVELFAAGFGRVWGASPDAVQLSGGPYTLTPDGSTYRIHPTGGGASVTGLWGTAGDDVFATLLDGGLVHYDGTGWSPVLKSELPLRAIWGSGPGDIYAVGDGGTMLHYDGSAWTPVSTGVDWPFTDLWGSGPKDIYVLDGDSKGSAGPGQYLHYDGTAWTPHTLKGSRGVRGVSGEGPQDVYMVDNQGTLWGGSVTSFVDFNSPLDRPIDDVAGLPSGAVFGRDPAGGIDALYGHSPGLAANYFVYDIWAAPWGAVYAPGAGGSLFESTGSDWMVLRRPRKVVPFQTIFGSSPDDIFALASAGLGVHYDGTSWTDITVPETALMYAGASVSDAFAVAVGVGGAVLTWDGTAWLSAASPVTTSLYDVYAPAADDVFAAGDYGTVLHYDGTAWSKMPGDFAGTHFKGIDGSAGDDVFACGNQGAIYHYDGETWTPMDSGSDKPLQDVWVAGPGDVFVVGIGGTILHYDGEAWTPMASPTTADLYHVRGAGPDRVYALAGDGEVIRYDGTGWTAYASLPQGFPNDLWSGPDGRLYAAGNNSLVASIAER